MTDLYFKYPNCSNCLVKNNTIPGAKYIFEDGRCFESVNSCDKYDCLEVVKDNPNNYDDINFKSCNSMFDTRVVGTVARYIRIERGKSINSVSINTIEAYDIFGNIIPAVIGRAYPVYENNYGKHLLSKNPDKIAKTLNVENAYVQIDLGKNYTIYMVHIINTLPTTNIVGNNLVLIKDDKIVSMVYHITVPYKSYYIITRYDDSIPEHTIDFEPYYYPSCVEEGCEVLKGYKFKFDKPIPVNDSDLLMPYDNRCFYTLQNCKTCLDEIKNNTFSEENINRYFISCDNSDDTMIITSVAKYIQIERTKHDNFIELSQIEAFNDTHKYQIEKIVVNPSDVQYDKVSLTDGLYNIFKTRPKLGSYVLVTLPENDTVLSHIYLSIPTADIQNMIGITCFIINKENYVIHSFTFTQENLSYVEQIKIRPLITTYILYITGTGEYVNTYKDTTNIFDYPSCKPDCIINGNQIDESIYKFSDGRCIKTITNCSEDLCLEPLSRNVLSYDTIQNNFMSCSDFIDTRIIPSYGRYVRIVSTDSSAGFSLSEITIIGQSNELNIVKSDGYPISNINGIPLGTRLAYDKMSESYAKVNDSTTSQSPFMNFDLGENKMITSITLSPEESLNGKTLYILTDKNEIIFSQVITVVPGKQLQISTPSIGVTTDLPKLNTSVIYNYPDCISNNCVVDGHLIANQQYEFTNTDTCGIVNTEDPNCLTNLGNLYGPNMDRCFTKCGTEDTRYPHSRGRIIRIKNISGNLMTISYINVLNKDGIKYTPINAYSKGVVGKDSRSDNILNNTGTTIVSGQNSYVQVDLGSTKEIYNIDVSGIMTNAVLEVISDTGLVLSSTNITTSGKYSGRSNVLPVPVNPPLQEVFDYPSCDNVDNYKDCVDINKNPKPYFQYNTQSGTCGISLLPCTGCLQDLDNTLLDVAEADMYFKSCNSGETRFPALRGRYVRIQSENEGFNILKLSAVDTGNILNVVNVSGYPTNDNASNVVSGTNPVRILNKVDNIKPFIQLDLGEDKIITQVDIQNILNDTTLSNKKLLVISSSGKIVYEKILNPFTNVNNTPQLPGTFDDINLTNTYNYDTCKQYGCLSNGNQIENQKYTTPDGRCFKAINNSSETNCLSKALANTLYQSDMDSCFVTCESGIDTRYLNLTGGQYIRIINNSSSTINISEIITTDINDNKVPIYSTYATGCPDINYRSDNINVPGKYVKITGINSYIQIMYENNNFTFKHITISVPSGYTFNSLLGVYIRILSNTGEVLYNYIITPSTPQLSDSTKIFYVKANNNKLPVIPLSEEFTYPSCSNNTNFECVSDTGLSKPSFKYNISNNRCVIAKNKCSIPDCMNKLDQNLLSITDINNNFNSCDPNVPTQFVSLGGRYVRIESGSNNGFSIQNIEIFDSTNTKVTTEYTRSYPLSGSNYSKYMVFGTPGTHTTVGSRENDAIGPVTPFVQLDFLNDISIRQIIVTSVANDTTLDGCILKVINSAGSTIYQSNIQITSNNTRYTFNITSQSSNSSFTNSNLFNTFNYNECINKGCIDENKQIDNQKYITSDGRCLKAKGYLPVSQCLDRVNTLDSTTMNTCFDSCSNLKETRYTRLSVRFIRIRQVGNKTSVITLNKLIANELDGNNLERQLAIVGKHCKPITNIESRSDNLNISNSASSVGYIQIDLGENKNVDIITINWSGSIVNTQIIGISQNGDVKYSFTFTDNKYSTSGESKLLSSFNMLAPLENINTVETYNYPPSVFDGSLDINNNPKIGFIYNLSNGLSVYTIGLCPSNDYLRNVLNGTVDLPTMNLYFTSTNQNYDTRFLNPVGRYIRIQRNDNTKNGFNITNITASNESGNVPISLVMTYPKNSRFSTKTITETTLKQDQPAYPFLQLDFGAEKKIKFIQLMLPDTTINGTTLYVINNNGNTISQYDLSGLTSGSNTLEILKIPRTYNDVPMSYRFMYDSCSTQGCIDENNNQYDNQKYEMSDSRCFKSIGNQSIIACLSKVLNPRQLYGSDMNSCFSSCDTTYDSRYPDCYGRFIRISNTISKSTNISLVSMAALDGDNVVVPLTAFTKNPINLTSHGENLIDGNSGTIAVCDGTKSDSYLQVDLGVDKNISAVSLIVPDNPLKSSVLVNTKIQIIKSDGSLLNETILNASNLNPGTSTITIPTKEILNGSTKINLVESFTWPSCDDANTNCVNRANKQTKPNFRYTFDNDISNRCLIAKGIGTDNILENVRTYNISSTDILNYFNSCSSNLQTQFSSTQGRYIRIRRINNTSDPINISNIVVKNKSGTSLTNPNLKTFVKPLKTLSADNYSYGKYLVDSDVSSSTITDTIAIPQLDPLLDERYIQIDLGEDKEIGSIEITHGDYTAAQSLNNTELIIINSSGNVTYKNQLPITTTETSRNIMIQNIPITPGYVFNNSEIFNWPCKQQGCITETNNLIKDFRYRIPSDGRCFKALNDTIPSTTLTGVIDRSIDYNAYFASCDSTIDTRILSATGRYVRISRTDGKPIQLSKFEARNGTFLPPVDIHVKPAIPALLNTYQSVLTPNTVSNISTGTASNVYMQLDLGSNMTVSEIVIDPATTDLNSTYLTGAKLELIREDGQVTYSKVL